MYSDIQKAVKNIESKSEIKPEIQDIKQELHEPKNESPTGQGPPHMSNEGLQRFISKNQQMALQVWIKPKHCSYKSCDQ